MQAMRFAGPFGFVLSIPLLYAVSPAATLAAPGSLLLVLFAMEQIGRAREPASTESRFFRALPILYIPVQLAVIAWAAWVIARTPFSFACSAALAISVGACAGVFGMLAAHELLHSRSHWERRLGLSMLFGMSYPHFRIAHVYGHHRHAATERDASTARLGESFYGFLIRTVVAQLFETCRFERHRTRNKGAPLLRNRVVQGALVMAVLYGLALVFSPKASLFMAAQSAMAILVLELFNYIAHYGLVRKLRDGRLERLGPHHSWNSSGLGNLLIFNMGHHSHHHIAPEKTFEGLGHVAGMRELPFGYAGSILLALVPPLWSAVMDHRTRPPKTGRLKSAYNEERGPGVVPT